MKHHAHKRKLGRTRDQREALLRSLAGALISNEQVQTTEAKAKALRPFIEKLVTLGRKGTLASRRKILSRLGGNADATRKLCNDIAQRYKERDGGYTRIVKLPNRASDNSPQAIIEFV